jgi:hypothetical protein
LQDTKAKGKYKACANRIHIRRRTAGNNMNKTELSSRLEKICDRLDELMQHDRQFIDPHAKEPVTMSLNQLEQYGKNFDERQKLTRELNDLASQPLED